MIKLLLKGDKVIWVDDNVSPDYQPKENEVLVEELPQVSLKKNEIAHIYYRNGKIEYEIKEKGE